MAVCQRAALTDTALPVQRGLEARITGALVGTDDVDAAAIATQVVTEGALVDICGGKSSLSSQPWQGHVEHRLVPILGTTPNLALPRVSVFSEEQIK